MKMAGEPCGVSTKKSIAPKKPTPKALVLVSWDLVILWLSLVLAWILFLGDWNLVR